MDLFESKEAACSTPTRPTLGSRRRTASSVQIRPSALIWCVSSSAEGLLVSYIGRRTTPLALTFLAPIHFAALFLLTRLVALSFPRRLGQHDAQGWKNFLLGGGWSRGRAIPMLALLAPSLPCLAMGTLSLGVASGVETLLPLAIILASSYRSSAAMSAPSSISIAAVFAPLLAGVALYDTTATPLYLALALISQVAAGVGLSSLRRSWTESRGARSNEVFNLLYQASPIAAAASTMVAVIAALSAEGSLADSLYPPPSFLLFIILITILSITSTISYLLFIHAPALDGDSRISSAFLATVPRSFLRLSTAQMLGEGEVGLGAMCTALLLGTGLVGWAWGTPESEEQEAEEEEFEQDWSRRSPSRSRSSSPTVVASTPSPGRTPPLPINSHPPQSDIPRPSFLAILPVIPFVFLLLQSIHPISLPDFPSHLISNYYANRIGLHEHNSLPYRPPTMDLVFSHFNEDLDVFAEHIYAIKNLSMVQRHRTRVIVYTKDVEEEFVSLGGLKSISGVEEVVVLPNLGREGGTYLTHILRHYGSDNEPSDMADLTLFLQHHLAWHWVAGMRWDLVDSRTGFIALGPYIKTDCGVDTTGNGEFPRMRDLYSMFREEFCPPTLQLSAWAGQFIVSRTRILANSRSKYETLLNSLQAPMHHWIHEEGAYFAYHGSVGPSNPFLGHALERSWPTIFNCTDPRISDLCKDDTYDKENCQCFDE